jgi:hypothetical protein
MSAVIKERPALDRINECRVWKSGGGRREGRKKMKSFLKQTQCGNALALNRKNDRFGKRSLKRGESFEMQSPAYPKHLDNETCLLTEIW